MWDKPIWERVASLETLVKETVMKEIKDLKDTMTDFIKEIRENYATKKELNEVKEKVCKDDENDLTKEVTSMNNRRLIWVVVIQWIFAIAIAIMWMLK